MNQYCEMSYSDGMMPDAVRIRQIENIAGTNFILNSLLIAKEHFVAPQVWYKTLSAVLTIPLPGSFGE